MAENKTSNDIFIIFINKKALGQEIVSEKEIINILYYFYSIQKYVY